MVSSTGSEWETNTWSVTDSKSEDDVVKDYESG